MKLSEIKEILKAVVISGEDKMDLEVRAGASGDLMSDILRSPKEGVLLLSGLNNIQSVRTAIIAGATALVLVRDKMPDEDMKQVARENGLPLMTTPFTMFTSCGRLFNCGLRGVEKKREE